MNKKLALVIAFATATALPVSAIAAGDKDKPAAPEKSTGAPEKPGAEGRAGGSLFGTLDADKDGFVTQAEAKKSAEVSANFKALDTDADGKISAQEMGGAQPK
jgi:hypothetical protein